MKKEKLCEVNKDFTKLDQSQVCSFNCLVTVFHHRQTLKNNIMNIWKDVYTSNQYCRNTISAFLNLIAPLKRLIEEV